VAGAILIIAGLLIAISPVLSIPEVKFAVIGDERQLFTCDSLDEVGVGWVGWSYSAGTQVNTAFVAEGSGSIQMANAEWAYLIHGLKEPYSDLTNERTIRFSLYLSETTGFAKFRFRILEYSNGDQIAWEQDVPLAAGMNTVDINLDSSMLFMDSTLGNSYSQPVLTNVGLIDWYYQTTTSTQVVCVDNVVAVYTGPAAPTPSPPPYVTPTPTASPVPTPTPAPTPPPTPPPTLPGETVLAINSGVGGTTSPVNGMYYFESVEVVSVSAIAASGYEFDYWLFSDGSKMTMNPLFLTMDISYSVRPVFTAVEPSTSLFSSGLRVVLGILIALFGAVLMKGA